MKKIELVYPGCFCCLGIKDGREVIVVCKDGLRRFWEFPYTGFIEGEFVVYRKETERTIKMEVNLDDFGSVILTTPIHSERLDYLELERYILRKLKPGVYYVKFRYSRDDSLF